MEAVLDVYHGQYSEKHVLIGMDESPAVWAIAPVFVGRAIDAYNRPLPRAVVGRPKDNPLVKRV